MTLRTDLEAVALKLAETDALLRAASEAHTQASIAFQSAVKGAVKDGLNTLDPAAFPATDHRRHHRPARIDTDPELQAFITARINRMTFHQIADDIAVHFPPERRARKPAIHAWWHRNKARK